MLSLLACSCVGSSNRKRAESLFVKSDKRTDLSRNNGASSLLKEGSDMGAEPDMNDRPSFLPKKAKERQLYVHLAPTTHDDFEGRTITFFVESDADTLLTIGSGSRYSLDLESGKRISIPMTVNDLGWDKIIYPELNIYVINNSDETLSFTSLDLDIDSSVPDRSPYFMMATYESSRCNEMEIANWGYSEEPYLLLQYTILREGESFDGVYDKERYLPGQGGVIDFFDDLLDLGYNYSAIKEELPTDWLSEEYERIYLHDDQSDDPLGDEGPKEPRYIVDSTIIHRDVCVGGLDSTLVRRLFSPFEVVMNRDTSEYFDESDALRYVFAPIYGRLRCPNSGVAFEFVGNLCLAHHGGYGAWMDYDESYDVQFDDQNKNYRIRFPYMATVEPGGSEKVRIRIRCDRSSYHRFRVRAVSEDRAPLISRDVAMRYFSPRFVTPILVYSSPEFDED